MILAVLVVLALGAAGTFGALYFVEKNRAADLATQVEGKDRQIGDLSKQVKDGEALTADLSDQRRKLENDNKATKPCSDAARALKAAAQQSRGLSRSWGNDFDCAAMTGAEGDFLGGNHDQPCFRSAAAH